MCKCTPNIRTPFCGKYGCEWPKPEGTRTKTTMTNKHTDAMADMKRLAGSPDGVASLPHFMSITDMRNSSKNLTHAIEVAETILKLKKLLLRETEKVTT